MILITREAASINKRKMANRPKKMTFKIITKMQIKVSAPSLYPEAILLRKNYAELGEWVVPHTAGV